MYYSGLRGITERQEWEPWIMFMLKAVEETAQQTLEKVNRIIELMDATANKTRTEIPKIYSKDLIEVIFKNPHCKIRFLERQDSGIARRFPYILGNCQKSKFCDLFVLGVKCITSTTNW